jgi:glycosyltransferase involved in cell wall biosynthesis
MKVLFINQTDRTGGAAVAAWRISEGLKKHFNTSNYFIAASLVFTEQNTFSCIPANKIKRIIDEYLVKFTNRIGLQYFSIPFHKQNILNTAKEIKPDIISLHNIHGSYFETGLLKRLSRICPIVWTLHDMWSFTGNSAYTLGNNLWKYMNTFSDENKLYPQIGLNTGKYLLRRKRKIYRQSDITIISPSNWLYQMAKETPAFENKTIHFIPYAIDLNKFLPYNKLVIKREFGIASESPAIFLNSDWIENEPRKGGRGILMILDELDKRLTKPITVMHTGKYRLNKFKPFNNFNIKHLGRIFDEESIIKILNAADLIIHPSIADNLPNMLIEAISCGTPAVAFNIGGIPDIIKNGFDGYLIEPFNYSEYAARIIELLNDDEMRNTFGINARKHAVKNYDETIISERYYLLYKQLTDVKRN